MKKFPVEEDAPRCYNNSAGRTSEWGPLREGEPSWKNENIGSLPADVAEFAVAFEALEQKAEIEQFIDDLLLEQEAPCTPRPSADSPGLDD